MTFLFLFLPIVIGVYYLVPQKGKNLILTLSGILFYAWGEPFYVLIMLLTIAIDYAAGLLMEKFNENKKARLAVLILSVVLNLSFLGVFKYGSFIVQNINGVLGTQIFDPQLALPIGISFYTFQAMSYTIDLYRRQIKVQRNIINFTAYVTLFPQLIAGPIVRYSEVEGEINQRRLTSGLMADGIAIFIRGLAKKALLANSIGAIWTAVQGMDYATLPMMTAWIGILAFAFQIYYDFSGYSDMAVGLGKMLGFHFPQNFDHPYQSKSVSEFWRRWHMTLTSWFKSYVYFPLGGNRKGTVRTIRNLVIVWALTGLWHGASWNFVLWGLYFGALIILEKFIWGKALQKLPKFVQWLYTFVLVVLGWVTFEMKTNSLSAMGGYFAALFGANGVNLATGGSFYLLLSNLLLFAVCAAGATTLPRFIFGKIKEKYAVFARSGRVVCELILFLICICYLVTSTYNPFLYFNF